MKKRISILTSLVVLSFASILSGCTKKEDCTHQNKTWEFSTKEEHAQVCTDCGTVLNVGKHEYEDSFTNTACTICKYDPYQEGRDTTFIYDNQTIELYNNEISEKYSGRITNITKMDDILVIIAWSPNMDEKRICLFDDSLAGKAGIPKDCKYTNEHYSEVSDKVLARITEYIKTNYNTYGKDFFEDQNGDGVIGETDYHVQSFLAEDNGLEGVSGIFMFSL